MTSKFETFFRKATGNAPFEYQQLLAGGEGGCACESRLINIPTGLGKTAAAVLAWLWNRLELRRDDWPRRLIYCLPMRTLVDQTALNCRKWLQDCGSSGEVNLHVLMGGEEARDWDLYPEKNAILIGTQDMLLSRALNRGYAMSRYRWPMPFGLLNNDCLWVLDEIQLMGPGVSTACQLEAFRSPGAPSATWYASATANPGQLATREWRDVTRPGSFLVELSANEKAARVGTIAERRLATKRVELHPGLNFGNHNGVADADLLDDVVGRHKKMVQALRDADAPLTVPRRTLVICNRVDRATAVYNGIRDRLAPNNEVDVLLMHSRFRPAEREQQLGQIGALEKPRGQIVVATQVIEAGVDLSSGILWTEIAPLACLVQRLGRLNRSGELGCGGQAKYGLTALAMVIGIDAPDPASKKKKEEKDAAQKEAKKKYLPYELSKCDSAWVALKGLAGDGSIAALDSIGVAVAASIEIPAYSLERHELLDLFDTDANLSLGFTDVSPFVRGLDPETDLYVAWREWPGSDNHATPSFSPDFQMQELCPVAVYRAREARAVVSRGWLWRGKEAGWAAIDPAGLTPGMTVLLPTTAGGYHMGLGWTGSEDNKPVPSVYAPGEMASDEEMLSSLDHGWRSIAQHTKEVESESKHILAPLGGAGLSSDEQAAIRRAISWHDTGKSHQAWQDAACSALQSAGISVPDGLLPLAKFSLSDSPKLRKADGDGRPQFTGRALKLELRSLRESFRPGMAHEVASALAFRQSEQATGEIARSIESLLAEYLIMSHHGRVRKVLRDEVPKQPRHSKDADKVRGVAEGDNLPTVTIAGGQLGCDVLSTDCRRMGRDREGRESYTRGVLRLLDHYGPFRLAFLEALFRAADIRASILAEKDRSE